MKLEKAELLPDGPTKEVCDIYVVKDIQPEDIPEPDANTWRFIGKILPYVNWFTRKTFMEVVRKNFCSKKE